jgi:hypothetical protein
MSKETDDLLISITLRLLGPRLDPEQITKMLGVSPDRNHKLGDAHKLPDGKVIHRKTGLWAMKHKSRSRDLENEIGIVNARLAPALLNLKQRNLSFRDLPGVEVAFLDVHILDTQHNGEEVENTFELSPGIARLLADMNLTLEFTINLNVEP